MRRDGLSALQRAVLNTGEWTYQRIHDELYGQGVDVSETAIRRAMRVLGLDTLQA